MRLTSVHLCLLTAVCVPLYAQTAHAPVDFEKQVRPLLVQKCHSCHGPDVQQSGLRLDKRQNAMRGGDYGPVIVPGKSAESKLIRRVINGDGGLQMPPTGPLTADEIDLLRAWIDQGADFSMDLKDEAPPAPLDPKVAAFLSAVRTGSVGDVQKLLSAERELVKAHDQAGSTPLHHAASFGSLATMKLLLDAGADVNARNQRASRPLHWAIRDEAKVRLLLERGAAIDAKQADGRTPVYMAASLGNGNAILRLLLDKGADANLATANGQTPLMAAAGRGDVESLRLLLANKAVVNARNGAGGTALMGAAASGEPRAVEFLLANGADAKLATKKNETALANAATAGVEESVRLLLAHGAAVNDADSRGYSPLMYAAGSEAMPAAIVKLLLAKGADVSHTGEGETARTLAAKRGDIEVERLLGVSPEKQNAVVVPANNARQRSAPEAVSKALALLEVQSRNFIRTAGCNSCHAQDLPSSAAAIARDHGIPAPREIAQISEAINGESPERLMDSGAVNVASIGWEMFDRAMNRVPKDEYTDAAVHYVKGMQTAEGYWRGPDGRRPPMNSGDYQTTALGIFTLKNFTPASEGAKAETEKALARAAVWLEKAQPKTTQERAFHLLALSWAGASQASVERAARALAAAQKADGGWNQLPGMSTDAYATGQALYALSAAAKMPAGDPAYKKGMHYLLSSQAEDGSWHVKTRSIWIQPYFQSGFPYDHDQWISAAGTAWATMALSQAVEAPRMSQK